MLILLERTKVPVVATDAKPRAEISLLGLCRGAKEGNFKLTDAKPRAEISLLNLCGGAKEGNCKLTDAPSASASALEKELTSASSLEEKSTLNDYQDSG